MLGLVGIAQKWLELIGVDQDRVRGVINGLQGPGLVGNGSDGLEMGWKWAWIHKQTQLIDEQLCFHALPNAKFTSNQVSNIYSRETYLCQ